MNVQVKFFALAKDRMDHDLIRIELPENATVADFRRTLAREYPQIADLVNGMMIAVDTEYATDHQFLHEEAVISCIPPVSGG